MESRVKHKDTQQIPIFIAQRNKMRCSIFFSVLMIWCCPLFVIAQTLDDWNGTFSGSIMGIDASLKGTLNGDQWKATINASGYPIELIGTVIDMECKGDATDPKTHETAPFTAIYAHNQINLHVTDINPITGQEENMEFIFVKTTTQEAVGTAITKSITLEPTTRDDRLPGLWRYTESYVSGEYSFATDYFIQFKSNGILLVTDGRTAGGGPTSSLDTGDGDTHQGWWKTENKTLYTKEEGGQWTVYAKYYVEGNTMMFTFNNGNKQVWERL